MDATLERRSVTIVATVFLPFAAGYFLSHVFRTVNAVIAEDLAASIGVGAGSLGLLTAAFLMTFAAAQIPVGILLDRYGPRRVAGGLLLFAAAGCVVFATGRGLVELAAGRALIGLGVSACLMAAVKAHAEWFPPDRLPFVNGAYLAAGSLGALARPTSAASRSRAPLAALPTFAFNSAIFASSLTPPSRSFWPQSDWIWSMRKTGLPS